MKSLVGTAQLVRLALRRDRWLAALWVFLLGIIPASFVSAIAGLYPDPAARAELVATIKVSPVFLAFAGQIHGASVAAIVAWRASILPVVIAIASLMTVIRHTRTEEETGRRELLGSTVTGRQSLLAAALLFTCAANLILGLLAALGMATQQLPLAGSLALGLEYTLIGWLFAAVAAVAAQLAARAGSARGLALGAVGAALVLRIVGDVAGLPWLTWLSPFGWANEVRPYGEGGEQWWVLALILGATALLTALAARLSARRDLGAGLLPERTGRAEARPGFRTPLALAWRLQRTSFVAWLASFTLVGAALGGVGATLGSLLSESPQMAQLIQQLGGTSVLTDAYFASMAGLFGLFAAGYALQATLRLQGEEGAQRGDPVLATAVSRLKWAGSHLSFGLLGPAAALLAMGLATGLVHGLNAHDMAELPRILAAALVQIPAVWVLVGAALALYGLAPRLTGVAWGLFAAVVLVGEVGTLLKLPPWALDLSPFTHVPKLPGGAFAPLPTLALLGLAAVLVAAGLWGFRRRDFGRG